MNNIKYRTKLFGRAVLQTRRQNAISQEKLAELTGLHRTYISDIERGIRNISIKNIFILSDSLKIKPSYLFQLIERMEK